MKFFGRRAALVVAVLFGFGLLGACAAGVADEPSTGDSALSVDAGKAHDAAAADAAERDAATVAANTNPGVDAEDEAEAEAPVDDADAPSPDPTPEAGIVSVVGCASNPTYDLSYIALSLLPGATTPCSGGCSSTQCCYVAKSVCLPK